jgi:hypothetical protein
VSVWVPLKGKVEIRAVDWTPGSAFTPIKQLRIKIRHLRNSWIRSRLRIIRSVTR